MAVFRRRPSLAAYWVGETLRVENYLTQRVTDVEPLHVAVLGALDVWRSAAELREHIPRTSKRALTAALDSGHLSGAGLDHFEGEQLPRDHPLTAMSNVVLTPHIGGATYDTEANHSLMIATDVAALLRGDAPAHCANPEVLS